MGEALQGAFGGDLCAEGGSAGGGPLYDPAGLAVVRDLGPWGHDDVGRGRVACLRAQLAGTAEAKAGVSVELLNRANTVLGTVTTDDQGYARFDAGLTRGTGGSAPAMVVVKEGDQDIAFLSLTDPEFDLSDRGVEGREAAPPVDVFVTTDRGAYRAGETVYVTTLARDAEQAAVEGLPLTAVLSRPDGVEYSRQLVEDQGARAGMCSSFPSQAAPRGFTGWRCMPIWKPRRWRRRPSSSRISCRSASTLT